MGFFNQKQEVIDLELTQHGKRLLSRGDLKPVYYAFLDDDILYDQSYAPGEPSEEQNRISERIKNETPRPRAQYLFYGVETESNRMLFDSMNDTVVFSNFERSQMLNSSLGKSGNNSNLASAWSVGFYKAPLSSSIDFKYSEFGVRYIPQLEAEYILETEVLDDGEDLYLEVAPEEALEKIAASTEDFYNQPISQIYEDGTYISARNEYIFLDIEEKNIDFIGEGFEIEVFEIEELQNGTEQLRPLKFIPDDYYNLGPGSPGSDLEITDDFVEYFFDIQVDDQISDEVLCDVKKVLKKKKLYDALNLNIECVDDIPLVNSYADLKPSEDEGAC